MDKKFEESRKLIIDTQIKALAEQNHLAQQTLDNLDVNTITPLTPEIISRQATQNIGTIGHVAHGKSTLVKAVSGVNVSINFLIFIACFSDCQISKGKDEKYYH